MFIWDGYNQFVEKSSLNSLHRHYDTKRYSVDSLPIHWMIITVRRVSVLSLWRPISTAGLPPPSVYFVLRKCVSHQFIKAMLDWALKTKHKNVGLSLPPVCRYRRRTITTTGLLERTIATTELSLPSDCHYRRTIATTGLSLPSDCHYRRTIATTGLSLPSDCHYHRTLGTDYRYHRTIATAGLSLPPYYRYQRTVDVGKQLMNEWELSVSNHGAIRPQKPKGLLETGRMGEGVWGLGNREIICLSLHCHHQDDFCVRMGDDESYFYVSLTMRSKVTRPCSQTTTFEEKGEQIRLEVPLLTSLTLYRQARPPHLKLSVGFPKT